MRLKWLKDSRPFIQVLVLTGILLILLVFYVAFSKYIRPTLFSFLSPPLQSCQEFSLNASQFLRFQNLVEENKKLKASVDRLTAQLVQLQEAAQENQRLRNLLSLPKKGSLRTIAALIIGKDSSNWTKTVIINRGALSGIEKGMSVIVGASLVGRIVEVSSNAAKVSLITDFNSKIPAMIHETREEGVVFGQYQAGKSVCKIKYLEQVEVGNKAVSSGLGQMFPKGLLIGEIAAVDQSESGLYKVAEIKPAIDFSRLEEIMVITEQ